MYYERLAAAVEEASGLPVLGYLPESEEYRMESRHLGLFCRARSIGCASGSGDWQLRWRSRLRWIGCWK